MALYANMSKRTKPGRPGLELTPDEVTALQAEFLATNRTKRDGSMALAFVRFCEARPEKFGRHVRNHRPVSDVLPTAVVAACRAARALHVPHRGGQAALRHETPAIPGTMRTNRNHGRRIIAGERASIDDATRNVACWIPWPWGGCPCSEKYGVRLGRWQTLVVHDDATSYIPFVSSVFRYQQSYRATDAALAIYRTETDIHQYDMWNIEGGVWQAKRTLAILEGRFHSAKGRPNQKLIENYFTRLWDVMAGQPGDVGRHRGEMKKTSDLYVAARQGRVDPREHFMSYEVAQSALYQAIDYLQDREIRSKQYGRWIPSQRWAADLEKSPRPPRPKNDHLILPAHAVRKVHKCALTVSEEGPLGCPMKWTFTADWLYQHEGRKVAIYFDPLSEWPVQATATDPTNPKKILGTLTCLNPLGNSIDPQIELARAVRNTMMSEIRVLSTAHTERHLRTPHGTATAIITPSPAQSPRNPRATPAQPPRPSTDIITQTHNRHNPTTTDATRHDLAASLANRAARAREALSQ